MTTQNVTTATSIRRETREGRARIVYRAAAHAAIIVVGLLSIGPLLWLIATSLKPSGEIFTWAADVPAVRAALGELH